MLGGGPPGAQAGRGYLQEFIEEKTGFSPVLTTIEIRVLCAFYIFRAYLISEIIRSSPADLRIENPNV